MKSTKKATKKVVKKAVKKAVVKKAAPKKVITKAVVAKAPVPVVPASEMLAVPSYAGSNARYCEDPKFKGFRMRKAGDDIRIHIHKSVLRSRLSLATPYVAVDVPKLILTNILKAL